MWRTRLTAVMLAGMMAAGSAGCATNRTVDAGTGRPAPQPEQPRRQMSAGKKIMLLAGAAAVYYLYQKHKNKEGEGKDGRYYRSKNGRVYYRNLKTGEYRWVDPPSRPIRVPASEYERYFREAPPAREEVVTEPPSVWRDLSYR